MPSQWRDALERKVPALFASVQDQETARSVLSPVLAGPEGERVAVACLRLCRGDLGRLKQCADASLTDYRDVLAWAEYPRQMDLGPGASASDQARATREDLDEYTQWLANSQK